MKKSVICPHFGICGGCSHQDVGYDQQLQAKEQRVRTALEGLPCQAFHPILPSPETLFYRNKMEYSFGDERDVAIIERRLKPEAGGRVHLGLHPKGRFALVTPTPECGLESEAARHILRYVAEWASDHQVPVYVRKTGRGDLRHVVIREGKNTGERLVNLVAKSSTTQVDDLAERLRQSEIPITTFLWSQYDGLSDVAKGGVQKIYWGDGSIRERFSGVTLKVDSGAFMQTNTHAAELMISVLRNWISSEQRFLIDLYCGSGAIGLSLAGQFDSVIGVELNPQAVHDARINAEASQTHNVQFIEGKAEEVAASLPVKEQSARTAVVVDPPRPGLHSSMVKTLLDWAVPWIFYVSCNPESLARDLRVLNERYDILDVQPMDFFPHTDHIETAVRLRRRDINHG